MGVEIHGNDELDKLIGQYVRVNFANGCWCEGILSRCEHKKYSVKGCKRLFVRKRLLKYIERENTYTFSMSRVKSVLLGA